MPYDAFISYSHRADHQLAPALQNALHRFAKPWWKMRAVTLFRDGTSLAAAHDLSDAIMTALDGSRFFIFMAAPLAAQSKWCGREVEHWLATRPVETLLVVLTEGTIGWDEAAGDFDWAVTDALPRSLSGRFRAEPLWIDLSWARTGEQVSQRDPRFQHAVAMLASRLHGKSLDEIAGEDVRQHRRTRLLSRAAMAGLAALTLSSVAGTWFAVQGERRAVRNLDQAVAATDTLVEDVAGGLGSFYGVPRDRLATILGRVETILTTLSRMEESDGLRLRRGRMMTTLALAYVELGQIERADALTQQAETLLEPLAGAAGPGSAAWSALSDLQGKAYDVLRRRSRYAAASARADRYRDLAERAVAAIPATRARDRLMAMQDLVLAIDRQRSGASDRGQLDDALRFSREAVAAADALLAAFPANEVAQRLAPSERADLADALIALGRFDEAMAELDAARAALTTEDGARPNRVATLYALVDVERSRAGIFVRRSDWLSALVPYENAARTLEQLLRADPRHVGYMTSLAMTRRGWANAASRFGLPDEARHLFAAANELFGTALKLAPDNASLAREASSGLRLEAIFLEGSEDREGALARLDRAAEIAEALVRQRGAGEDGIIEGLRIRASRARMLNNLGRGRDAAADLERAGVMLDDLGRPAEPGALLDAINAVVDLSVQWGYAGRLDRSLALIDAVLGSYGPPEGVSDAALVGYRIAVAKLHAQRAAVLLDGGRRAEARRVAAEAVAGYETGILPHNRTEPVVQAYAMQVMQLARIAGQAGDPAMARDTFCALERTMRAVFPQLDRDPRLRLTALDGAYNCLNARLTGSGETDRLAAESEIAALLGRADAAFPTASVLITEWQVLIASLHQLRVLARMFAADDEGVMRAIPPAIGAARIATERPDPPTDVLIGLAFLHDVHAGNLKRLRNDLPGAVKQRESQLATLARGIRLRGFDYLLKVRHAEAQIALALLLREGDPGRALSLLREADDDMRRLDRTVPERGRAKVLEQWTEANWRAGDLHYGAGRHAEAVAAQREALLAMEAWARLAPDDPEVQLDLGRQHARLGRTLAKVSRWDEATGEVGRARAIYVAQRARPGAPEGVEGLVSWTDKALAEIETSRRSASDTVEAGERGG